MSWPAWTSMLGPWQWAALAVIPPAIIALYFLKLKRQPLEVPSTYLWHKSIEDLHVNSIWQRLRQSILLFLQLLLIALLALALLRPSWQGSQFSRHRLVFLIDNSASMSATDVGRSRLDEAKLRVRDLIDQLASGDLAMIVSFSDAARVEQMFSDNRSELRRRLDLIQPTDKTTSISEALRVASVQANPAQASGGADDAAPAEPQPAQLFIFSDGNFADDPDFSLGNLEPTPPVWIGDAQAANIGIVAFEAAHSETSPGKIQAFGRLQNFGLKDVTLDVELLVGGGLADAQRATVRAGQSTGVSFDLDHLAADDLELRLTQDDNLAVDNRAWAVARPPRRSRVLLVTPGNDPLETALRTERAGELAEITRRSPDVLETSQFRQSAETGAWDLIIFDRCAPAEPPAANTLYIGRMPPGDAWKQKDAVSLPQIIDINRAHPLMQWLDMSDVLVVDAHPLTPPAGSTMLIESTDGALVALAPREGFEDAVTAFELVGDERIGTNWPVRPSFPVFVLNVLEYLGGNRQVREASAVRPGEAVVLRPDNDAQEVTIDLPEGGSLNVARGKHNVFHFAGTNRVGLYHVHNGGKEVDSFAVNLFDERESNIKIDPARTLKIGHTDVGSGANWEPARRETWKWVLLGALAILLIEWYIYNRRAYL